MTTYVYFTLQKFKSEKFHMYIKEVLNISCTEAIFFFSGKKMFLIS